MITDFYKFLNESKNYPLYKGISKGVFDCIMKDYKIKNDGTFNSPMRKRVIKNDEGSAISATRNFEFAKKYGIISQ